MTTPGARTCDISSQCCKLIMDRILLVTWFDVRRFSNSGI